MLEARAVRKVYVGGDGALVEVLRHVDLAVARGEIVAIVGASGVGKSTLLHLLGALDVPTSGEVVLEGNAYSSLAEPERDALRSRRIGFVFQFHHLLRDFTALENVMMPLLIGGEAEDTARDRASELLASVGLAGRLSHRPAQLSGGEQQRCAVARALVHDPQLVLADEPSGNLDHYHGEQLHQLLFGLVRELESTLVVVTHNRELAERADRILRLQNGVLAPVSSPEVVP
jgi:lipoprotein-releasing system ATP-binding protein